jgi:tetratricopeptide (TPR) repeat protein
MKKHLRLIPLLVLAACHRSSDPPPSDLPARTALAPAPAAGSSGQADSPPALRAGQLHDEPAVLPVAHHHSQPATEKPLELCPPGEGDPLTRARLFYDKDQFDSALACAARACADDPDSPDAHAERGADLVAVGRLQDAQLAFSRALALEPDHLDALLGAADLFVTRLPGSRDNDELALVYSERGLKEARREKQGDLVGSFALESAMALNDLGRPQEALERADEALKHKAPEDDAIYEKASALYELCRFGDARTLFNKLVKVREKEAFARYHLGLIAERSGDEGTSKQEIQLARQLDPEDFPEEVPITAAEFVQMVDREEAALPDDMKRDIAGVPITTQDLPDLDDLVANDPPLSPAILGLFRGPPLAEKCDASDPGPCRSIVLYRKNLARVTRDKNDLEEQVRVTLLHEIGHLRGEDDMELAARGLE